MSQKDTDFLQAYALLTSLHRNIKEIPNGIEEPYVTEYHNILDRIENTGIDVSNFRIPESYINRQVQGAIGNERFYTEERYVDKPFMLTKVEAIITYIKLIMKEKPKKMGFDTPNDK